jgi:type II secretory pathway component PulM
MSVTASFEPERIAAASGGTAALALHLQNNSDAERMVTLRPSGDLAAQTVLQSETIYLDPNEHFEVTVIVDANTALVAGSHDCVVDVVNDDETATARATIDIEARPEWSAVLEPPRSKSASVGRHKVAVTNAGNVPLMVTLVPFSPSGVTTEIAAPSVNIDPGQTAKVELRLAPASKFWNGDIVEHSFSVNLEGSDHTSIKLDGFYEQGPRVRSWFGPALAGVAGSLLLGTLAWFAVLRPSVENIATEKATERDAAQQTVIDAQVADMRAAAEEAAELPLGRPADVRLAVTTGPASSNTFGQIIDKGGSGRIFSITDVIFQNPTGAAGRVQLVRQAGADTDATQDKVLLDQELANFRDLDFHLVAPLTFESNQTISLRLTCTTPGPGTDSCEVSATVVGFIDDV